MAREKFMDINFKGSSLQIVEQCLAILSDYSAQGYDLSLRQLYYQLVSRNVVPNTEQSYKRVGSIISDARLGGFVDWNMIDDRGRGSSANPHWETPASIMRGTLGYAMDLWAKQKVHVEVMVEKDALSGVLEPVCSELDITFSANKGYSSSSALFRVGRRLRAHRRNGKDIVVIYLGDHDPSGIDMTRDVRERLQMFSRGDVDVRRVALNMEQIEALNPPENPAKMTDSRAAEYVSIYGDSSWELDAIEPAALAQLVRDAVLPLRDPVIHAEALKLQQDGRTTLQQLVDYSETGAKLDLTAVPDLLRVAADAAEMMDLMMSGMDDHTLSGPMIEAEAALRNGIDKVLGNATPSDED